jgi:tetratricopeptide (TPR) repeat protein
VSRICSKVSRDAIILFLSLALSACAIVPQTPSSSSPSPPPPSSPSSSQTPTGQKEEQTPPRQDNSPRAVASLRLTEQARVLLETGKVDDAITTLERAINLNPSNGQNYYYMAEAWLRKGNPSQAREFNRLAAMYLKDDPNWIGRVKDQQERIRAR